MFKETQEDYLRYLLFDDQEDDLDFLNTHNNLGLFNQNSNLDGNLFNSNEQGIEPENNPFSTNSMFNNNKVNDFDKQQEEINQHLTEMSLNEQNLNQERFRKNSNQYQENNYRRFSMNNGTTQDQYEQNTNQNLVDENQNQGFNQNDDQRNETYYNNSKLVNNQNGNHNNTYYNSSQNIQSSSNNVNGQLGYNNYQNPVIQQFVQYDSNIGQQVQSNGDGYYQRQTTEQQYNMVSSSNQQPENIYNNQFLNNSVKYIGQNENSNQIKFENIDQQINQQSGGDMSYYQAQSNRGDNFKDNDAIQQQRNCYQQNEFLNFQQPQQQQRQSQTSNYNYSQAYPQQKHQTPMVQYSNDNIPQLNNSQYSNNSSQHNSTSIDYNNSNYQYNNNEYQFNKNEQQQNYNQQYNTKDSQYNNNSQVKQEYSLQNSDNSQLNHNSTNYNNNSSKQINNDSPYINDQTQSVNQQQYVCNYQEIQKTQQQTSNQILSGQIPFFGEMKNHKRKSQQQQTNSLPVSRKSSSTKDMQFQKYEKKYTKAEQSKKLQKQLRKNIHANSVYSATTLQYPTSCTSTDNASQCSSTDNQCVSTPDIHTNNVTTYNVSKFKKNSSNLQQISDISKSQDQGYENQVYQSHHCCDGEESICEQDKIENEDENQKDYSYNGNKNSSQLNDSNDSKGEKGDFLCEQEGDQEKSSKDDEIAILAESIKHCNKKNVVKNIMSAFLTYMNDRKYKIYTEEEQECIPTLYHSTQIQGGVEEEDELEEIRKKFKRYISQKSLNHYTVRLLILHPNYGPIFQHYLTNPIKKWINNSKVADLGAHIKMIGFFLACFQDNSVLEELKRHEKKRAHFS